MLVTDIIILQHMFPEFYVCDEIRENHVTNVVDDKMDGNEQAMAARGELYKSIISSLMFPISSLGNVVPPVLHITLGVVLKYSICW